MTEQIPLLVCEEFPGGIFAAADAHHHDLSRTAKETIEQIAALRGRGMSIRSVAGILGVGFHTVLEVERRHSSTVATHKERVASVCFQTAGVIVESLLEDALAGRLKPGEKALSAGILLTKAAELRGEPGTIIEKREVSIRLDDVRTFFERASRPIECESTVIPSNPKQKATSADAVTPFATPLPAILAPSPGTPDAGAALPDPNPPPGPTPGGGESPIPARAPE